MGMGIGADPWGEGVFFDDDFTTGTVVELELEDDVGVDTEEETKLGLYLVAISPAMILKCRK